MTLCKIRYSRRAWPGLTLILTCCAWIASVEGADYHQSRSNRDFEKAAERILAKGMDLVKSESYGEAFRELVILLDYYRDFSRMDEVVLMLADCLYEMELYHAATAMYRYLVKTYFGSPLLPKGLLGLQKVKFRQGNYQESLSFYEAILQAPRPVDVDDEARYYAGQSYYHIKDYPSALEALLNIDSRSDFYDYGLYSVGLSLLRMKRVKKAVAVFRKLVTLPIIAEERRAVVDEGRLTLGFLYYELGYYKESLKYFNSISQDHTRYADALLAAGWSSIKQGDYQGALDPLVKLVRKFPHDHRTEEALFLLGRSYLQLGLYDDAINVYQKIVDLFPEEELIPNLVQQVNRSLETEEDAVEKLREDLLILESRLLDVLYVGGDDRLPEYLREEKQKLDESREALLETIMQEHQSFEQMQEGINELRQLVALKMERKSWRAYAEYGKSRALFLRGTATKRGG